MKANSFPAFVRAVFLLLSLFPAGNGCFGQESPKDWILAIRVAPQKIFMQNLFAMKELAGLKQLFPEGALSVLPTESRPNFENQDEKVFGIGLNERGPFGVYAEKGRVLALSNLAESGKDWFSWAMDAAWRPPSGANVTSPLPAFPASPETGFSGWVSPKLLAVTLRNAFVSDGSRESHANESACLRNARTILRMLKKEQKKQKTALQAGPLKKPEYPKCPLGGTYALAAQSGVAASTPNAPDLAFKVLCDHKPAPPLPADFAPASELGTLYKPVEKVLLGLPDLPFAFRPEEGNFAFSLPAGSAGGRLYHEAAAPHGNTPYTLSWVPWEKDLLPLSENLLFGIFAAMNFDPFFASGRMAATPGMTNPFKKPGIMLVSPRGINPEFFFRGGQETPPALAVGFPGLGEDGLKMIQETFLRGQATPGKIEEQGQEYDSLQIPEPGSPKPTQIAVIPGTSATFLSPNPDVTAFLTRRTNGEDRAWHFQPLGEEVKFLLLMRFDLVGKAVGSLIGTALWERECQACRAASANSPGPGLTAVPPELASACPRNGLMIGEFGLMCAVHNNQNGFMGLPTLCDPEVDYPTERWLMIALFKKDGKSHLEISLVKPEEQP